MKLKFKNPQKQDSEYASVNKNLFLKRVCHKTLDLPINSFLFVIFFYECFFFSYIQKCLITHVLRINKRTNRECNKSFVEGIKAYSKKSRIKSNIMVVNDIKISLAMKNKGLLSTKNIIK